MNRLFPPFIGGSGSVGLLLLRLALGAALFLHGLAKMHKPTEWMNEHFPHPAPAAAQAVAAVSECGGGVALALGLLTPLAALALAGTLAGALCLFHLPEGHPFVSAKGPSAEAATVYLAAVVMFLFIGPGKLSADWCLFGRKPGGPRDSGQVAK